jgi:hypothetical protein
MSASIRLSTGVVLNVRKFKSISRFRLGFLLALNQCPLQAKSGVAQERLLSVRFLAFGKPALSALLRHSSRCTFADGAHGAADGRHRTAPDAGRRAASEGRGALKKANRRDTWPYAPDADGEGGVSKDQSGRGAASKQSASIPAPAAAPRRSAQTCLPFIFSALIARSSANLTLAGSMISLSGAPTRLSSEE